LKGGIYVKQRISTLGMPREEWLLLRRTGLGGSDAAAILGVHPYKSAYAVWADKRGLLSDDGDNEAMRQGRDLEEYVARRFCEKTGKRVQRLNAFLRHPEHDWMTANIDRRVVGERAGLECKTSKDLHLKRYRNGEYPIEYYCQCQWYMAVTGWPVWHLAVLVYGTDLLTYEIPRDEEDVSALMQAGGAFWMQYVQAGIQPPTDGSASTERALSEVFAASDGRCIDLVQAETVEEYIRLKGEQRTLEERLRELSNGLKSAMGEAERMEGGGLRVDWKSVPRRTLDAKRLRAEHPEIDFDKYTVVTHTRRFEVKGELA